ncbi:hypothetical protein [Erythrobacter crassostreae]|uniref:Uncharacterized protein n=1 Tax=Erythrobacter crassostreae TaxID=2828328 RepID=A0A9X1JLF7_9SPHN|nr:hypothetical protein [Erythrobacter crassostrea]MBV7258294.1 hypothetical protein [Erythrobacter crassostrea]
MIKTASRLTLTVATVSMAFLPVAAHANTRAGDNGTVYGAEASSAGAIFGAVYDDEEISFALGDVLAVVAGILAGTAIITLLSGTADNSPDQSRGT